MKTYEVILKTPYGVSELFTTNSLNLANKFFDEYASKRGIKKEECLIIYGRIKTIKQFKYE